MSSLNNKNGIWFYGLSGSGKTYASSVIARYIKNPFIIDGDQVRKFVSSDLGYELIDRKTQIKRILGIGKICIQNGYFPIMSSVIMDEATLLENISLEIEVVEIIRPVDQLIEVRELYATGSNIVGRDIQAPNIDKRITFKNNGTEEFEQNLISYATA